MAAGDGSRSLVNESDDCPEGVDSAWDDVDIVLSADMMEYLGGGTNGSLSKFNPSEVAILGLGGRSGGRGDESTFPFSDGWWFPFIPGLGGIGGGVGVVVVVAPVQLSAKASSWVDRANN